MMAARHVMDAGVPPDEKGSLRAGKAGEVLWMKVPYDEGIAGHVGPESCRHVREGVVEALTGEQAGWVLSSEILTVRDADAVVTRGRQHRSARHREGRQSSRGVGGPHARAEAPHAEPGRSQGRPALGQAHAVK
jgi:hypothetical protein